MSGRSMFWKFFLVVSLFHLSLMAASQEEAQQWYEEIDRVNPVTRDTLTLAERKRLLGLVSRHKVASLDAISKYDTTGEVGFCFGRAMTAHLIARKMGLSGESIRKLFIIGDLRSGPNPEWRFHVTTLVKGTEDGRWHAIDPIMLPPIAPGTPLAAQQWIDVVQRVWDRPKQARFFFAHRDTVMPDMRVFPATKKDEKGERVIELTFDPAGKPGFTPFAFATTPIFDLDLAAEEEHFLRSSEPQAGESFPFLGMGMKVIDKGVVTEVKYDFNGYFVDLLDDLRRNELEANSVEMALRPSSATRGWSAREAASMTPARPNLHSFRIRGLR